MRGTLAVTMAGALTVTMAGAAVAQDQDADCLRDSAALRTVLALPGSEKSGRRFCLAPGRYGGLGLADFDGAFTGIDPARPVVFEAADPADPPILPMWIVGDSGGALSGNVVLRGLAFDLTDEPEVPVGQDGFRGHRTAIVLGFAGPVANVEIDAIRVTGGLREARFGGRETERFLKGVVGRYASDVTVRNSRFERITDAITLGGTDIVIEGNRMRHSWGDLVRTIPQVTPTGCQDTDGVVIRNNVLQDPWSNNRMHPDVIQMFAASGVPCSIKDVLIEGNVAFPGRFGLRQPIRPTGLANTVPAPPPPALPDDVRVMHRLVGPGATEMPEAVCPERPVKIAVQNDGLSGGAITVESRPGGQIVLKGRPRAQLTLAAPWETWRFTCRPAKQGEWQTLRQVSGFQGMFLAHLPGGASYRDIVIRHNILWVPNVQALSVRSPDNARVTVLRNSFIKPLPGDADGDGAANTAADGLHPQLPGARMVLAREIPGLRVEGNIASGPGKGFGRLNDLAMRHNDGGRAAIQRFVTGPGPQLMPETLDEAVRLARPRPGGPLDGRQTGAVGTTPAEDPYDWSWAAEPW